jgi:hypothetical protein
LGLFFKNKTANNQIKTDGQLDSISTNKRAEKNPYIVERLTSMKEQYMADLRDKNGLLKERDQA